MFRYLVMLVATVASLVHDVSWWDTKELDFPRTQYLFLALPCLPAFTPFVLR